MFHAVSKTCCNDRTGSPTTVFYPIESMAAIPTGQAEPKVFLLFNTKKSIPCGIALKTLGQSVCLTKMALKFVKQNKAFGASVAQV